MAIVVSPELEAKLRERAELDGVTIEGYIERIVRHEDALADRLEALALEGINSGESIVADDLYWAEKRQQLIERHQKTGTR